MKINKYIMTLAALAAFSMAACSDEDNFDPFAEAPEPPIIGNVGPVVGEIKPKAMWIDAHANFQLLSSKANIDAQLARIKQYGLNMIYLDVKPGNGYALYKSDILPPCDTYGNQTVTRDYDDYLQYFLDKCEELEIDVVASVGALGFGYHAMEGGQEVKQGYIFDNWAQWGNKQQIRSSAENPGITVPIADDVTQPIVMLNPSYPEVQTLLINICTEIVAKYPKIKGISLDYLRYNNNDGGWYGLGDYDLADYANYWAETTPARTDIVTATGGRGPKFAQWIEYRSNVITQLLTNIRSAVKSINPDCEIHLWASADWGTRYSVGQNWASKTYIPSGGQYTPTYNKTGFADQLDVFVTGAYSELVWIKENPSTVWTVENFVKTWNNYIKDECKCYGSIAAYALNNKGISDATYLCLKHTDGYMTFELSHVNNGGKWIATLDGIRRYEKSGNEDEE